jgi:hypothetical protein
MAGHLTLDQTIEVRILVREREEVEQPPPEPVSATGYALVSQRKRNGLEEAASARSSRAEGTPPV